MTKNNDITAYNTRQSTTLKVICDLLLREINENLSSATAKLYHANPVWFINENPIVGYDVADDHVNLLFWSGQSFDTAGLKASGKFKAAGTSYTDVEDIDLDQLRTWLKESQTTQWNYKDLRENNGELLKK